MTPTEHFAEEVNSISNSAGVNQALDKVAVGDVRWAEGGVSEDALVDFKSSVDSAGLTVGEDEVVVGNNVGNDIRLLKEEGEVCNSIVKAAGTDHGGNDSVASENSGAGIRVDGLAGGLGGRFEVT